MTYHDTNLINNVMIISTASCVYTKLATAGEFLHQNSVFGLNGLILRINVEDSIEYLEQVAKKDP